MYELLWRCSGVEASLTFGVASRWKCWSVWFYVLGCVGLKGRQENGVKIRRRQCRTAVSPHLCADEKSQQRDWAQADGPNSRPSLLFTRFIFVCVLFFICHLPSLCRCASIHSIFFFLFYISFFNGFSIDTFACHQLAVTTPHLRRPLT